MANEIKELGIVELLNDVLKVSHEDQMMMSWDEETDLVLSWANENDYYVYSRPKDEFFRWEGIELAEAGGYKGVIFENLS